MSKRRNVFLFVINHSGTRRGQKTRVHFIDVIAPLFPVGVTTTYRDCLCNLI